MMDRYYGSDTLKYISKERARYYFSALAPRLFCRAERIKNRGDSRAVGPYTNLVVEGYPRSGNSFTFHILNARIGQRPWHIAHHVHLPVQIKLGIAWKRPVLVLVRAPEDAIVSFVALQCQATSRKRDKRVASIPFSRIDLGLRLREAARYYCRFHKKLLALQRHAIVIAPFHIIVSNVGDVFGEVNNRFGLNIPQGPVDEQERNSVFGAGGYHLSPNRERDNMKREIESLYATDVPESVKGNARAVYAACLEIVSRKTPEWVDVATG